MAGGAVEAERGKPLFSFLNNRGEASVLYFFHLFVAGLLTRDGVKALGYRVTRFTCGSVEEQKRKGNAFALDFLRMILRLATEQMYRNASGKTFALC